MRQVDGAKLDRWREAFQGAVRQVVLDYARGTVNMLNTRMDAGEAVEDEEVPDGFSLVTIPAPLEFKVPEDLPVSR
eukprot:2520820-Amphidinium_carterae.1